MFDDVLSTGVRIILFCRRMIASSRRWLCAVSSSNRYETQRQRPQSSSLQTPSLLLTNYHAVMTESSWWNCLLQHEYLEAQYPFVKLGHRHLLILSINRFPKSVLPQTRLRQKLHGGLFPNLFCEEAFYTELETSSSPWKCHFREMVITPLQFKQHNRIRSFLLHFGTFVNIFLNRDMNWLFRVFILKAQHHGNTPDYDLIFSSRRIEAYRPLLKQTPFRNPQPGASFLYWARFAESVWRHCLNSLKLLSISFSWVYCPLKTRLNYHKLVPNKMPIFLYPALWFRPIAAAFNTAPKDASCWSRITSCCSLSTPSL